MEWSLGKDRVVGPSSFSSPCKIITAYAGSVLHHPSVTHSVHSLFTSSPLFRPTLTSPSNTNSNQCHSSLLRTDTQTAACTASAYPSHRTHRHNTLRTPNPSWRYLKHSSQPLARLIPHCKHDAISPLLSNCSEGRGCDGAHGRHHG